MRLRVAIIGVVLAASLAAASLVQAREPDSPSPVSAQQLFAEALAGEEGKEVVAQTYVFPAGAVLPWHIHPDAHEIAYVLEGTLTFERAGEAPREIKAGEADYLPTQRRPSRHEQDRPAGEAVRRAHQAQGQAARSGGAAAAMRR